jgi:hypothetical protein
MLIAPPPSLLPEPDPDPEPLPPLPPEPPLEHATIATPTAESATFRNALIMSESPFR